jgi:hypothetical protein
VVVIRMQPHNKVVSQDILKGLVIMQNSLLLSEGSNVFVFEFKYHDLTAVVRAATLTIKFLF